MTRIIPILLFCLSGVLLQAQVEVEERNHDERPLEIIYRKQIPREDIIGPYPAQNVRIVSDGYRYRVTFFVMYNDTLRSHSAEYRTMEVFDKAYYKWESDNRVVIRLHNSKSKNQARFQVWGKGCCTDGMQVLDK